MAVAHGNTKKWQDCKKMRREWLQEMIDCGNKKEYSAHKV